MDEINKKHIQSVAILVAVALVIGIYLIATTVIISRDGVFYIEQARNLSVDFHKVMTSEQSFGLPVLIASFHHILSSGDSGTSWTLSSQIGVLICKTFTIIVLYLLGIHLVSQKQAFWAVLILVILPYPAKFGSDVLRDWPHLLFLSTSLLLFYVGIQKASGLYLFGAGLISALGCIMRPECAQVMVYGLVFFATKMFSSFKKKMPLWKNWIYLCLLTGFLMFFLPYALKSGNIIPVKLGLFYHEIVSQQIPCSSEILASADFSKAGSTVHAAGNLLSGIAENLMYYFVLPAAIGLYLFFLKAPRRLEDRRLLIGLFIGFYVTALCMLDIGWGYISRRHVLPLTVMLCFVIPTGIEQIARWLNRKSVLSEANLQKWIKGLIAVGILICLPKLLTPMGYSKREYRKAACWIAENTAPCDIIETFDVRIPFYANRKYHLYYNPRHFKLNSQADYLVTQSKNEKIEIRITDDVKLEKTFSMHSSNKKVLIFKRIP